MTDKRIHPETGQVLRRDVRGQTVQFGPLSRVVEVPGWYPEDDGDALFTGADLKASNTAFLELRAEYAAYVKAFRKSRGLTQEEAGWIIGGGRRAFQKYESGKMLPGDAAVGLIEVLAHHPEALLTLRNLRSKVIAVAPAPVGKKKSGPAKAANRIRRTSARKLVSSRG